MTKEKRKILERQVLRLSDIIEELKRKDIHIFLNDTEISKKSGGYITQQYLISIQHEIVYILTTP